MAGSLVIHTAFLGDLVLVTPLLEGIRRQWPQSPLYLLTTPAAGELFRDDNRITRLLLYDKHNNSGISGFLRLIGRLRKLQPERVFLAHRYLRSSLLGLFSGAAEIHGFREAPFSSLFRTQVPFLLDLHETERQFSLLSQVAPEIFNNTARPLLPRLVVREELPPELTPPEDFVVLAPGSVWRSKRWPHYGKLMELLLAAEPQLNLILLGGAGEAPEFPASDRIRDRCGRTTLRQSYLLLRRARCLVCNDSAPLHLGQAAEIPTIALFGSTVPAFGFGPQGQRDRVLSVNLSCKPCSLHGVNKCPRGDFPCLEALRPEAVAAAVLSCLRS